MESSSDSSAGLGWRWRHRGVPKPAQNIPVFAVAGLTVEQFSIASLRTYRRNAVQNFTLHYITLHWADLTTSVGMIDKWAWLVLRIHKYYFHHFLMFYVVVCLYGEIYTDLRHRLSTALE